VTPPSVAFSPARIATIALRNFYLFRGSWPRVLELFYWPTLEMIMWGFTSKFLMTQSGALAHAAGLFLGAVLLWDMFFRGQLGISITFLEEIWSRSLGHLFITPLRPFEYLVSLCVMSLLRVSIGLLPAILLAIPFYGYSLFSLGPPLILFFVDLLMLGWAIGIAVNSIILLKGLGAEGLAWLGPFLLTPVSAVYYPVSVLPPWLRDIAFFIPTSHVFEAMRAIMFHRGVDWADFAWASALDLVYLAIGCAIFLRAFTLAREQGALMGTGE
jgi:ABC-2 type transport system permease protein